MKGLKKETITASLLIVIWSLSILMIAYRIERTQIFSLLSFYTIAFIAYAAILYRQINIPFKAILISAILTRLFLLFAFPLLSDDIYRFIWDGRCWYYGIHAFEYTPSEIIRQYPQFSGLNKELFSHLNSPNYFSVYPLVCQLIFYLSVLICPDSIIGTAIIIKLLIFLIELSGIYYLIKLVQFHKWNRNRVLIYILNPLVVIEIFGNAHFEGAMAGFFIIALYYLIAKSKIINASFYWALSIASKMVSAIFLPIYLFKNEFKKNIKLYVWIALFSLPLWFLILLTPNIFTSINLYFQNFEFNASIYYILRWIGTMIKGYNPIHLVGPFLSISSLLLCLTIAWYKRKEQLPYNTMLLMFSIYLFLATTVHPWYLILMVLLSLFTGYIYPLVWSALIVLTYANYKTNAYHEELILISLEYIITMAILLYELINKPFLSSIKLFQLRQ